MREERGEGGRRTMQPFVLIYIDTILSRKHDLTGPIFKNPGRCNYLTEYLRFNVKQCSCISECILQLSKFLLSLTSPEQCFWVIR